LEDGDNSLEFFRGQLAGAEEDVLVLWASEASTWM
jgi:hypothetical protein